MNILGLLLYAQACFSLVSTCDLTLDANNEDVNVLTPVQELNPSASLVLCLGTSSGNGRFIWNKTECNWISFALTIQYMIRRPTDEFSRELWFTELFTCNLAQPQARLQFSNLVLKGSGLIWQECSQEWCTHCLTPDFFYLFENQMVTVIDRHPQLVGTEPYYTRSQCIGNENLAFFSLDSTAELLFVQCTLLDIRVRAQAFVRLTGGKLTLQQTVISGLDFDTGFIMQTGASSQGYITIINCTIRGLNRDHPYLFKRDTGLIVAHELEELLINNSSLVNNLMMPSAQKVSYLIEVDKLHYFEMSHSIVQNCMGSFTLNIGAPKRLYGAVIDHVVYESSYSYGAPNWNVVTLSSVNVLISDVLFANNRNNYPYAIFLSIQSSSGASAVSIRNSVFTNNQATNTGPALFNFYLLSKLTVFNCSFTMNGNFDANFTNIAYEYLEAEGFIIEESEANESNLNSTMYCEYMTRMMKIGTLEMDSCVLSTPGSLCLNLLAIDTPALTDGRIATVSNSYFSNYGGYGLNIYIRDQNPVGYGYFFNCTFVNSTYGGVYLYTYVPNAVGVFLENCLFLSNGDSFGNEAALDIYGGGYVVLRNCSFINNQGNTAGAVYFLQLTENPDGTDSGDAYLEITNCTFSGNSSPRQGGDVYSLSPDGTAPVSIYIADSIFNGSASRQGGGSLSIANAEIKSGLIANCFFTSVSNKREGIINIEHSIGMISLTNLSFTAVNIQNSALIFIRTPSNSAGVPVSTHIQGLNVFQCVYQSGLRIDSGAGFSLVYAQGNVFFNNTGIALWNDRGEFHDEASVYRNNRNALNPCSFQNAQSVSVFHKCQFLNNSASERAGVLEIRGPGTVATFTECLFEDNFSEKVAGVGHIEMSSLVQFQRCRFFNNSAMAFAVFGIQTVSQDIEISNSVFAGNQGEQLMLLETSAVHLNNVTISNVSSDGFVLFHSTLKIANSLLKEFTGTQGCVVNAITSSSVSIVNSTVTDVHCSQTLFIFYAGSSLTAKNSTFARLSSHSSSLFIIYGGGFLNFTSVTLSEMRVYQVTPRENQSVLNILLSSASIFNSSIRNSDVLFLQASDLLFVQLRGVKIETIAASRNTAGAVHCISCVEVDIQDTVIRNVTGGLYGGMRVESVHNLTMLRTLVQNASGSVNGAVSVSGGNVQVTECELYGNLASGSNSQAGALYFTCALSHCTALISKSFFNDNHAYEGGAIYWDAVEPALSEVGFLDNEAEYGDNLGTMLHSLELKNSTLPPMASGQVYDAIVEILLTDVYGQVIVTDSFSEAWMAPTSPSTVLTGSLKALAVQGVFQFSNFTLTSTPGVNVSVSITVSSTSLWNSSLVINFNLRECEVGEILVNDACLVCSADTYAIDINSTSCTSCPSMAKCKGGARIYPLPGYWRPDNFTDRFFRCFREHSCLGSGNYTNLTGLCEEGYTGHLCQSCVVGYNRSFRDSCQACSSRGVSWTVFSICVLGFILFSLIVVRSALASAEHKRMQLGIAMKLLMNYFQLIMLASDFNLNWPSSITTIINHQNVVGIMEAQLFGFNCFLPTDPLHPLFPKLLILITLPFVFLVCSVLIWTAVACIKGGKIPRDKCVGTFIVLLFFLHPMIVRSAFSAFYCFEVLPDQKWLREEMAIRCWENPHAIYTLGLALPGVLLWGFFAPALVLGFLIKRRKHLSSLKMRRMFGFLYLGYKEDMFFWEFIIIYRKVGIIILYVFLSTLMPAVQALIILTILLGSLLLHLRYQAFFNKRMNGLETRIILTSSMVLYSGLFFVSEDLSYGAQVFFLIVILTTHLSFLMSWLRVVLVILLKYLFTTWPRCMFQCCPYLLALIYRTRAIVNHNVWKETSVYNTENQGSGVPRNFKISDLFMDKVRRTNAEAVRNPGLQVYSSSLFPCE